MRVVYVVLLLGYDNRSRFQLFIVSWDITEDLFIVIIVLWLIDPRQRPVKVAPGSCENTADERGLVHAEYLDKTLTNALTFVVERLITGDSGRGALMRMATRGSSKDSYRVR